METLESNESHQQQAFIHVAESTLTSSAAEVKKTAEHSEPDVGSVHRHRSPFPARG
jgi:hypothetical protein